MKTIKDLGRAKKIKHPGLYDDISDEELGRALKIKNPGVYDDFVDVGLGSYNRYEEVDDEEYDTDYRRLKRQNLSSSTSLDNRTQSQVEFLQSKLKPNKGWFSSWLQSIRSQRNIKFIKTISENQLAIIEQGAALERAARDKNSELIRYNLFIKQNEVFLLQLQANESLIQDAANKKLPIENYGEHRLAELQTKLEIKKHIKTESFSAELNIKKERELSKIKVKEHKEIADINLDNDIKRAQEELRLEIIAKHLSSHQQISFIQDLIESEYIKIDNIKTSNQIPEGAKEDIIKSRERIIQMYMNQQNETLQKTLPI